MDALKKPRIALVVANSITGDSRVLKSAVTADRLGFDVLLIGTSATGERVESWIGGIHVVRVVSTPPGSGSGRMARRVDGTWELKPLAPLAFRTRDSYSRAGVRRVERRARTRDAIEHRKARIRTTTTSPVSRLSARLGVNALRMRSLALDGWFVLRRHAFSRAPIKIGRSQSLDPLASLLREELPLVQGYVDAMTPELDAFQPDLVHAHDMYMSAVGATYARHTASQGRRVPWVYDAHEWVSGLRRESATKKTIASERLETLVIHEADAVVTVGDAVAEKLVEDHSLPENPSIVMNAPPRRQESEDGGRLRREFRLDDDTPLLVYHGVVKPKRGLTTAVEAMRTLPGVHLALVADPEAPHVVELKDQAARLGVADRLHVHPYVPADAIASFVSDATAGIHPLTHSPNAEVAIPTKLLEYLQAQIPVLVSDTAEMASFVRRHGIGEVFTSGDASSFSRAAMMVINERSRYLGAARELAEDYTWERQEPILATVYGRILGLEFAVRDEASFVIPVEQSMVTS